MLIRNMPSKPHKYPLHIGFLRYMRSKRHKYPFSAMPLLNCLPIEALFEVYFMLNFEDVLEVRRACKYLTVSVEDHFWNKWATKSTTRTAKHFRESISHQSEMSTFKKLKRIDHYTRECLHMHYTTSVPLVSDFIFRQLEKSPMGRRFTYVLNLTNHLNKKQSPTFRILLENTTLRNKIPKLKNFENIAVVQLFNDLYQQFSLLLRLHEYGYLPMELVGLLDYRAKFEKNKLLHLYVEANQSHHASP